MRRSNRFGMKGVAGFNALAACSLLLVQGRPAEAQNAPSNAGDAPVVNRSSAIVGRTDGGDAEQQSRLLIAHGLEMTIEGSTLQGLAMRSAGVGLNPAVDSRPSAAGVVGSSSVRAASPGGSRVPVPASVTGTGYTGAGGETVSGRPVGNGNGINTGTKVAGLPDAPQPGNPGVTPVVSSVPLTANEAANMLQRQAMRSFEAGERLLNQGMAAGGPGKNLSEAATRYANTLRSIASQPVIRVASTDTVAIRVPGVSVTVPSAPRGDEAVGADPASVALINHGVKGAIGAVKIRHMIRQMGGTSGPAGQQLMEHAQMMESESQSILRTFAGNGTAATTPTATGFTGSPNGMVQALAQQANDLISAMQGSSLEAGNPSR